MNATIMALSSVAVALTFERFYLRSQHRKLRIAEQTFTFHRLRDELQLLAVNKQIEVNSLLYDFLATMLNLGIKNASTLRASQVMQIAKRNSQQFSGSTNETLIDHVKMYNHEVKNFVGICFYEFSKMLMINDPLYSTWRVLSNGTKHMIKRALDPEGKLTMPPLIQAVFPESAENIKTAVEFRAIGNDLCLA
jgi:hypothetical protein